MSKMQMCRVCTRYVLYKVLVKAMYIGIVQNLVWAKADFDNIVMYNVMPVPVAVVLVVAAASVCTCRGLVVVGF